MSAEIGVPWRNLGPENESNDSDINQPRPPLSPDINNSNNNNNNNNNLALPPLPDLIPIKKSLINSNLSNCNHNNNNNINNNNHIIIKGDGGDETKPTTPTIPLSGQQLKKEVLWPQETAEEPSPNENNRKSNDRMKQNIKIEGECEAAESKHLEELQQQPGLQQKQSNNDDINIGKKTLRRRDPSINYNISVAEFQFYGFYKPISRDNNKSASAKKKTGLATVAATNQSPAKKTQFNREKIKEHRKANRRRKITFGERKKQKNTVTKLKASVKTKRTNSTSDTEEFAVLPRINPIFLWVKQDDTKIVEVRCEDYDKRNRIRLTKTSAGWRAIPRTEGLSPLRSSSKPDDDDQSQAEPTPENDVAYQQRKHKKKSKKKKKKKKRRHPSVSPDRTTDNQHHNNNNNIPNNNLSDSSNSSCNQTNHSDTDSQTIAQNQIGLEKQAEVAKVTPTESQIAEVDDNDDGDDDDGDDRGGDDDGGDERSTPPPVNPFSNIVDSSVECIDDNIESQIPIHTIVIDKNAQLPNNNKNAFSQHNNNNNILQSQSLNNNCSSDSVSVISENELEFNNHKQEQVQQQEERSNNEIQQPTALPLPPPLSPQQPSSSPQMGAAPTLFYQQLKSIKYDVEESGEDDVQLIPTVDVEEAEKQQHNQQLIQLQQLLLEQRKKDEKWSSLKSNGEINANNNATMCPDAIPVYDTFKEKSNCIQVTEVHPTTNLNGGINLKNLSDFSVDCHDLIEKIKIIQSANTEDLLGDHSTMLGADLLLDSLIEQRCEDNHISGSAADAKEIIYTIADDYNDDDDILMEPQPVADIISRLGESLSASPKCLSFNEAGEIEHLSGNLFDSAHNVISIDDDDNHIPNPFAQNTELHDLTLSIEDLTEANCEKQVPDPGSEFASQTASDETLSDKSDDINQQKQQPSTTTTETVSTNSSDDDNPKDLTCRKSIEQLIAPRTTSASSIAPQRPISHCSEVQSPQPSGIPAVPPSPDLFAQNRTNSNDSHCTDTITISESPKRSFTQQKEPLNLGKCRKSASPTVSCSEEAHTTSKSKEVCFDEPLQKRVKTEIIDDSCEITVTTKRPEPPPKRITPSPEKSKTDINDPDALTQLRLLYNNPTWKVPDPLLVPKDRLNAVLASPAREIPLLLTTRPELRLPEAFAFPAILQDPNILVISLAQLEAILQKQDEITKAKAKLLNNSANTAAAASQSVEAKKVAPPKPVVTSTPSLASGLAGDIDAATAAAFNQMLWMPYLSQIGQYGPELIKAMMSMAASQSMPDMMPFGGNQLEYALWQEAMAQMQNSGAQTPRKSLDREFQKLANSGTTATKVTERKPVINHQQQQQQHSARTTSHIPLTAQQKKMAQMMQQQNKQSGLLSPNGTRMFNPLSVLPQLQMQQQFGGGAGAADAMSKHNWPSQRTKSSKTELSAEQKKFSASMAANAQNPFLPFPSSYQEFHEQQEKMRKEQLQLQLREQFARADHEQKPRVQCKSLSNLLHQSNKSSPSSMFNPAAMSKMSQLMAAPGIKPPAAVTARKSGQYGHQQVSGQHKSQEQHAQQHQQQQSPKLKVKPGLHLLDPTAQRRLLNLDDYSSMGSAASTPSTMDESPDINSPLWHPLFGSAQKSQTNSYNSPWQWTTITAMGE